MTTLELLKASRERISDISCWTRGTLFADQDNFSCDRELAVRTCAIGSVYLVSPTETADAFSTLSRAARQMGYQSIAFLNDELGHRGALAMFDTAISMLEIEAGLAEPSIPIQVPAPAEEPRETPYYPPAEPQQPAESPAETPVTVPEREPVPA